MATSLAAADGCGEACPVRKRGRDEGLAAARLRSRSGDAGGLVSGSRPHGRAADVAGVGAGRGQWPRAALLRDLFGLLQQDRANIAAGLYRLPDDLAPDLRAAWRASQRFLSDLGRVDLRRRRRGHREVAQTAASARYPAYYLRNFHY